MKWYIIPGTDSRYEINKDGLLKTVTTGRIWKGSKTSNGYYELTIECKRVKIFRKAVYVILAELFLVKPEGDYVIDHKDNDKTNNKLENLVYITRAANASKGSIMRNSETTKKKVAQYTLDGTLIKIHESVKEACITIGVNSRSPLISYACKGKCSTNNCNTAYGYKWSSVDGDIVQPHN